MTKSLRFESLLLLPCFALLSACASDSGSGGGSELTGPTQSTEYQKNSCIHSFDEGVNQQPGSLRSDVKVSFFKKSVDMARLRAVSDLSARATADFMRGDGVDTYYVPVSVSSSACSPLSALPQASGGLFEMWKGVDSEGGVLGLFLPVNRVREHGAYRPVIMVRPDTDRYTLVHEYMHFVFNKIREDRGYTDERFLREFNDVQKRYEATDAANENSSRDKIIAYLDAWMGLASKLVELSENFALEEMTIEALLTDEARAGRLKHVTEFNRKNSVEYIRSSSDTGAGIYKAVSDDFEKVMKLARKTEQTAFIAELETLVKRMLANMNDMEKIKTNYATSRSSSRIAGLRAEHLPTAALDGHDHTKCGRSALLSRLNLKNGEFFKK